MYRSCTMSAPQDSTQPRFQFHPLLLTMPSHFTLHPITQCFNLSHLYLITKPTFFMLHLVGLKFASKHSGMFIGIFWRSLRIWLMLMSAFQRSSMRTSRPLGRYTMTFGQNEQTWKIRIWRYPKDRIWYLLVQLFPVWYRGVLQPQRGRKMLILV